MKFTTRFSNSVWNWQLIFASQFEIDNSFFRFQYEIDNSFSSPNMKLTTCGSTT